MYLCSIFMEICMWRHKCRASAVCPTAWPSELSVLADNYLPSAHTGRMNKSGPAPVQSVSQVPGPYLPEGIPPTPPPCGNHYSTPLFACNSHSINSLNFCSVDESVTANPRFCPFLALKSALLTPKWPLFRQENHAGSWPHCRC